MHKTESFMLKTERFVIMLSPCVSLQQYVLVC